MGLKWVAKAIVQKMISFLPNSEKVNFLFQKHVTKAVLLTNQHFDWKITHARDHVNYFLKFAPNRKIGDAQVLELGTGWYPIVPIALFLNGFKNTVSIDIQSWMTVESQLTTVAKFKEWRDAGKLEAFLPNLQEDRWNVLMSLLQNPPKTTAEFNAQIHLKSDIIDGRNTGFEAHSFDFICSNNTFEHIPKIILVDILKEFKRLLKPDGVMSHFIDMTDHFAHFDKSITEYNFLKFSSKQWRLIDNSIQPQNRMRWADYQKIYRDLDIKITAEEVRKGDVQRLKTVKIHPEFAGFSAQELAISHGYLVSASL